jgi:ABC-2 type transport system ATP-binding protein
MTNFVTGNAVRKHYGATRALDGIDFSIEAGEVVGLIGPNGAGKSTLLKALLGLIHFDGELTVLGQSPRKGRAEMLKSVSYIADVASLPGWMLISRLLDYMQGVHPRFNRDKAISYLDQTEISVRQKVDTLSKGMKTQLHLALIMAVDARFLVLDEPTLGLDVIFRTEFHQALQNDFFNPERSILVTTHQVEEIEEYLTRVMFINKGRICLDIPTVAIGERFVKLTTSAGNAQRAEQLTPIHSRKSADNQIFIFDGTGKPELADLGETSTPNLAELFVAIIKGQKG